MADYTKPVRDVLDEHSWIFHLLERDQASTTRPTTEDKRPQCKESEV